MLTYDSAQPEGKSLDGTASVNVLLVSDGIETLSGVKTMLHLSQHRITYAQTAEELYQACQGAFDFVIVDVGPEHLVYVLRELRTSLQLQNVPLLVRFERLVQAFERTSVFAKTRAIPALDAERLAQESALTAVFTKYRAMPGSDAELSRLVAARVGKKP